MGLPAAAVASALPYFAALTGATGLADWYMNSGKGAPKRLVYRKRKRTVRRYSKKKKYKTKRKTTTKKLQRMSKKLTKLSIKANAGIGSHTHRIATQADVLSADNTATYTYFSLNTPGILETHIALFRYYDSNTNTVVTRNISSLGNSQKIRCVGSYHKLTVRGNFQSAGIFTVYHWQCKDDTNSTLENLRTAGLTDVGNPTASSPEVYPTDSPYLTSQFRIVKKYSFRLEPGMEKTMYFKTGGFFYNPGLNDTQADGFVPAYHSGSIMIRHHGVTCHSTAAGQHGLMKSNYDYQLVSTYKYEYEAGMRIKTITLETDRDTMTESKAVTYQNPDAFMTNVR